MILRCCHSRNWCLTLLKALCILFLYSAVESHYGARLFQLSLLFPEPPKCLLHSGHSVKVEMNKRKDARDHSLSYVCHG
jgi:hypothetical protein